MSPVQKPSISARMCTQRSGDGISRITILKRFPWVTRLVRLFYDSRVIMLFAYTSYRIISGDSLTYHRNCAFTTWDKNDGIYCAEEYHGAWWYKACHNSNLNGRYYKKGVTVPKSHGIIWYYWKGNYVSYKTSTMKMRPSNFRTGGRFFIQCHIRQEQFTHRDRHIYIASVAVVNGSQQLTKCHPAICYVRSMSLECISGLC